MKIVGELLLYLHKKIKYIELYCIIFYLDRMCVNMTTVSVLVPVLYSLETVNFERII